MANGWNRPSGNVKPAPKKNPTAIRGALAGIAVVILAAIAAYFIFTGNETRQNDASKKDRGRIKEVTPAAAPKAAETPKTIEPQVKEEKPKVFKSKYSKREFKSEEEMKKWEEENVSHPGIKTGKKPMPTINIVESEIHLIVNSKPGDFILPTPLPTKNFDKMMQEVLLHKMEIEEDDTPERIEEIKRVEEAKAFLRQELKAGKDLRTVLEQCREDMRKAADQMEFMKAELKNAVRQEGMTIEDARDFEAAANKILKDKGIDAEIKMSGKDRKRLEHKAKLEKEQSQETQQEGNEE